MSLKHVAVFCHFTHMDEGASEEYWHGVSLEMCCFCLEGCLKFLSQDVCLFSEASFFCISDDKDLSILSISVDEVLWKEFQTEMQEKGNFETQTSTYLSTDPFMKCLLLY